MASNNSTTSTTTQQVRGRQHIDMQRIHNVLLIWLDANIDENNEDCQNTMKHLRRAVNELNAYTDGEECIQFIKTIKDRKVYMIISDSLGQHIVPRVHHLFGVDSIFIFYGNKQRHDGGVKDWPKIRGVFTEIKPICAALKQAAQLCEQNAVSMSFVASGEKLDQLDPSFMYTLILKEILLTIQFDNAHIQDYVNYCREVFVNDDQEVENVNLLERKYHEETPIWWYTFDCFFVRMLNRGIRLMDGDIMTRMGFFINDLHRCIDSVNKEQHIDYTFTVYRGQGLSLTDFEQLKQTKDGLMSFNSFLSTTILFVMTVDPKQSTATFAFIRDLSAIEGQDEVLFAMHSVFRIQDVKATGGDNKLFEVSLTLTSDNDKELPELTEQIRQQSFPDVESWHRLSQLLTKLRQNEKAAEIYEMLLDQTTKESEKAPVYHQLGLIKDNQGEYEEAIRWYEQSLTIYEKTLSPQDPVLVASYNNIGNVYKNVGDYPKAFSYYEKALAISQQSLSPNHSHLASTYNNIGLVYDNMGDYPQALSYHEKALAISQQSLPPNHPHLAVSFGHIGNLYKSTGDNSKALAFCERAVEIAQQPLPSEHPHLLWYEKNLDDVKKLL
ncbi:unnamed protein product [Adineta ricciae]|uniref:Uncharacterized protein n=1 Tax=Adineta ricciae TaxID=249248 RepID=A0A815N3R2_ADIRI|nr:unnamed protein product [Adineta ricciae]